MSLEEYKSLPLLQRCRWSAGTLHVRSLRLNVEPEAPICRPANSSTRVSHDGVSLSERERVAEDAGTGEATGEDADELDGVDVDSLAVGAVAELAAGRAFQHQLKGLAMDRRPFGDDVGHEAAVVVGGQVHLAAGRHADVD